jgi:IclR family acetate operon transcriptional repressor
MTKTSATHRSDKASGAQTVKRALSVLEALASVGGEVSVSELATRTDLPQSTVHRLLSSLIGGGYVRRNPGSRKYLLGARLVHLGNAASQAFHGWTVNHLRELVDASGETANLAVLDNAHALYVAQAPSRHKVRMFSEVGNRVLPHSTAIGKVLLAFSPSDEAKRILESNGLPPRTPNTITDLKQFMAELDRVRQHGYAIDDEEEELGVVCLAVPIIEGDRPVAAISISGPAGRLNVERHEELIPMMQKIATNIAAEWNPST